MRTQFALALSAFLAASPDYDDAPSPDELTDTEAFSMAAGQVLGAATQCDSIPKERVKAAAGKVDALTQQVAEDDDELTSAQDLFNQALQEGSRAVAAGEVDCDHASTALADMENKLK